MIDDVAYEHYTTNNAEIERAPYINLQNVPSKHLIPNSVTRRNQLSLNQPLQKRNLETTDH